MVNCFSRIRHRTDNMESDHFYGPRRNGRSHSHISWSNPIVNQPLAPDWEPFIPPNPFSSYEPMNFERASPHHRIAQPPRGILRGAQQSRPFDGFGSPNSNQCKPNSWCVLMVYTYSVLLQSLQELLVCIGEALCHFREDAGDKMIVPSSAVTRSDILRSNHTILRCNLCMFLRRLPPHVPPLTNNSPTDIHSNPCKHRLALLVEQCLS
jgi:hypothetical protein